MNENSYIIINKTYKFPKEFVIAQYLISLQTGSLPDVNSASKNLFNGTKTRDRRSLSERKFEQRCPRPKRWKQQKDTPKR